MNKICPKGKTTRKKGSGDLGKLKKKIQILIQNSDILSFSGEYFSDTDGTVDPGAFEPRNLATSWFTLESLLFSFLGAKPDHEESSGGKTETE